MPRPHSLPRKRPTPAKTPFPALHISPPPMRALAGINVQRGDKAFFDDLQAFLSYREGRSLQQCEAFCVLVDIARKAADPRLHGFAERRAEEIKR